MLSELVHEFPVLHAHFCELHISGSFLHLSDANLETKEIVVPV